MKQMDEMEQLIQIRSEQWGYRAAKWAMISWLIFNSLRTLIYGTTPDPVPCFVFAFILLVQIFSQQLIKQKMIAGDEEYRAPNKLLQTIVAVIVIAVLVMSFGVYLLMSK